MPAFCAASERGIEEHAGPDNYSFVVGNGDLGRLLGDFEDDEADDEADEVETTGESSDDWK